VEILPLLMVVWSSGWNGGLGQPVKFSRPSTCGQGNLKTSFRWSPARWCWKGGSTSKSGREGREGTKSGCDFDARAGREESAKGQSAKLKKVKIEAGRKRRRLKADPLLKVALHLILHFEVELFP